MKQLIKQLLREGYANNILLEELSLLIEKEIEIGQSLVKKLNNVNKPYADKLLSFLKSNNISDKANIDAIDYSDDDDKTLTAYAKDRDGNLKGRKYKVGKLLTSLGIKLSEFKGYELEDLISHLKKGTTEDFKLVSGDKILWAYHCDNYDEGETMGSCMRYEAAQSYLQIYTENPNSVNCLVLINPTNNKVRGRALIWHTDADEYFMDRVYLTNNQYKNLFLQYAEEHGYKTSTRSTISLENAEFDEYPFMDTFEFLNKDEKILMTNNDGDESTVRLNDTSGNANNAGTYIDLGSREGEYVDEDEAYYVSYKTPDGYREGYAHQDDTYYYNDEMYLMDDMVRVYDTRGNSSYIFKYDDDNPHIELTYGHYDGDFALLEDSVQLYIDHYGDDVWTLNNDDVVQLYSDKYGDDYNYAMREDVYSLFDGKYGEGEWAFHNDTKLVSIKDYGSEYVLIDDLDNMGEFKIEQIHESQTNKTLIKKLLGSALSKN
jgi:hypothetical protein